MGILISWFKASDLSEAKNVEKILGMVEGGEGNVLCDQNVGLWGGRGGQGVGL